MTDLTKQQKAIYDFIEGFVKTNGYSPTYREILGQFGFSSLGTVYKHLSVLKRKGVLSAEPNSKRSIKPIAEAQEPPALSSSEVAVPFIGQLTANAAIEMFPQIHTLSLPSFMVGNPAATYVLRARGDAWIDEQIADGDLVVVDAQREAGPNETVVARIHGKQTIIKRVFPEGQHLRLVGGTPGSESMVLKADQVEIQGIVTGVVRLYM